MIDSPKRYDAWNSTGICKECRREPYCKKMCKAVDRNIHKLFCESLLKTSAGRIAMAISNELRRL